MTGRRSLAPAALLAASVAIVAGAFICLYAGADAGAPAGGDTPHYVWRARLVAGEGLDALPDSAPDGFKANAFRPGYPTLAGFLDTVAGIDPVDLTFAVPAIMGTLIALGAGAFATQAAREPPWAFPVYAVAVGTSVGVVLTAVGRVDNIIVDGLTVAAATTALLAADGRRGAAWATGIILAGATLVHWSITLFFAGILGALALALLPESLRARREGAGPLATPSGRLGVLLAGSAAAGGAALALAPAPPELPSSPELWRHRVFTKLDRIGPRFAALAPAVGLGVWALLVPRDPARRRALFLALIWAGAAAVAVALALVGPVPAHRILPSALGIPLLAAAAVTAVGRALPRIRPGAAWRLAAAGVVVVALAGGLFLGRGAWTPAKAAHTDILAQAGSAGRYVASVDGRPPIIFVSGLPGLRGAFNVVRSALPVGQITRAYVYLGETENLLDRRPTLRPGNEAFNRNSQRHWAAVRPVLDDAPIIISLSSLLPESGSAPAGTAVAPGVTLVRGPSPDARVGAAPRPETPSGWRLAAITVGALLLFAAVGLGFARWLVPTGWMERAALAPALGVAVLILGGVMAGKLGAAAPVHRWWIAPVVAGVGWAPLALSTVRRVASRRP